MKRILILLLLGLTAHAAEPRRWGVRLAMSNEGAPAIGADYLLPVTPYLQFLSSIDSSAGDNGPWVSAGLALRIPLGDEHGIVLAGGIASVAGEHRSESKRVLAPDL